MLEKLLGPGLRKAGVGILSSLMISAGGCGDGKKITGGEEDFPETSFAKTQNRESALSVHEGSDDCPHFVLFSYKGQSPKGEISQFEYRLDTSGREGTWLPLESQFHTDNQGNWVNNIYFSDLCLDPGNYTLFVRSVDPDGQKDPTPAEYKFSI
ncbi:MAG: hypothetical protein KJ879_01290 [Nanoarchaeota archaeon]|nr:hypothetical protein [Nanoarchaeota archaeon]